MTSPPTPDRGHPLRTAILVSQLAFGLMAMTICLPSLQDWRALFDASQASVQLTFSGYVVAYGGMQLVYGPVSDRVGRKPVLITGLLLVAVASVLAAFAQSLPVLVLTRVLQGAGSAAGMVTGRALVQDLYRADDRTRVTALIGMSLGLCPPLATLIGGQLHVHFGWRANFVLMAVLAVLLALGAWKWLPSVAPRVRQAGGSAWSELAAGYGRLLRTPAFVAFVGVIAMTTTTFYTFLAGAPIVLAGYGVSPDELGWYVMCIPISYMLGNLMTTRLIGRLGERRIMLWGQSLTVLGLLITLAGALAGFRTPWALALPLTVLGVGHGLLVPPSLVGSVGLIPGLAGSAAALTGLMQQLGGALGGYVVGLVTHDGATHLALLMLGWGLLGAAFMGLLRGRTQRRAA